MDKCDHTVGHDWVGYDLGEWFYTVSEIEDETRPRHLPWNRFNYCPTCGASLETFWSQCDAKQQTKKEPTRP